MISKHNENVRQKLQQIYDSVCITILSASETTVSTSVSSRSFKRYFHVLKGKVSRSAGKNPLENLQYRDHI